MSDPHSNSTIYLITKHDIYKLVGTISLTLNHQPITISAAYCPPCHNITPNQFNDHFNYLGSKFLIGGDINAKHTQWGCHTSNPHGNLLHRIITLQQYKILSPSSPTYWPNSPRKRPDILDIYITKISNSLNCYVTNLNEPCSDHSPVLLTIDTLPPLNISLRPLRMAIWI